MYTIRSTSDEGVHYLVNGWNKHRAFWMREDRITEGKLFKREQDARRSLTKLLKVMPEYESDTFEMVFVEKDSASKRYVVKENTI